MRKSTTDFTLLKSLRHHIALGLLLGLWLVLFLVLISPFDVQDLSPAIRIMILPPYGLIIFGSYLICTVGEYFWMKRGPKWSITYETLFTIVFLFITMIPVWLYYKSSVINGLFGFTQFCSTVYLPISAILIPIVLIGRRHIRSLTQKKASQKVALTGEGQSDVLHVVLADLIAISSAKNYVEVYYINGAEVTKSLLRSSLKKVLDQVPDIIQVHRSHAVNPHHFVKWKDKKFAIFYTMKIPISDKYKVELSERI